MSIGKRLAPLVRAMAGEPMEVEVVTGQTPGLQEDGSVVVEFGEPGARPNDQGHYANLAETLLDSDLSNISSELLEGYDRDKLSRDTWEQVYKAGLDQLGLKVEERNKPWAGACGVFHPLLGESVVDFQAATSQEIFPSKGPCKTSIVGDVTPEVLRQAQRVQGYMNYTANRVMTEYFDETEMLLFALPLAGSAFRKVYHDPEKKRPCAMFVPVEDFVVAANTTNLDDCERATHVMVRTQNWLRKRQYSGFYRTINVFSSTPEADGVSEKKEELIGVETDSLLEEDVTLLEMHVLYDLPGYEHVDENGNETGIGLPYVITIDKDSGDVLSIYRNWKEGGDTFQRRNYFVQYKYLPGLTFYGFGLVHMIGGLSKTATSLLRQLVDAGTLANLQAGFKTRGLNTRGDNSPLMPGEFRDVDVAMGTLRDNIFMLPFKEPSMVLYNLLGDMVEQGRRFASSAQIKVSELSGETPVGTTLAVLEQSLKVISGVQRRLHRSMGRELQMLADLIKEHGPREYPYDVGGKHTIAEDFDDRVDIIPVSDPNSSTMAMRIMQHQAVLQLSAMDPEVKYDKPRLHRSMVEVLGFPDADKIVPTEDDLVPTDPVTENMSIINGKPVKAFQSQDHEAHLQVHMTAMQIPQLQQMVKENPKGKLIMGAMMDHINEHIAFAYRARIEKELGAPLPPPDEPLPQAIETRLAQLVAPAAAQLTGKAQQQAQAEENARKQQDPIVQMQKQELDIKQREQQSKDMERRERLRQAAEKLRDNAELERGKLFADIIDTYLKAVGDQERQISDEQRAGIEFGLRMAEMVMNRAEQETDEDETND